jgi:putative membrane protein
MWNGNGHWDPGAGSGEWLMLLFMLVFVVAIIVAIIFIVRYLGRTPGGTSYPAAAPPASTNLPESPKDILKRRYAAGEIDRDEYLQKLGDL